MRITDTSNGKPRKVRRETPFQRSVRHLALSVPKSVIGFVSGDFPSDADPEVVDHRVFAWWEGTAQPSAEGRARIAAFYALYVRARSNGLGLVGFADWVTSYNPEFGDSPDVSLAAARTHDDHIDEELMQQLRDRLEAYQPPQS